MNTEILTTDDYLPLGMSLVLLHLHGHQYPARHRAAARLTLLSTWTSCSDRDGVTERGALVTALPHLTTTRRVRAVLLATRPADTDRAAGLRFLLATMTTGHNMQPATRQRSEENATTALAMADGLLEALPELIDPTVLDSWLEPLAQHERQAGRWVMDLLEDGHDVYDLLAQEAPNEHDDWDGFVPDLRIG